MVVACARCNRLTGGVLLRVAGYCEACFLTVHQPDPGRVLIFRPRGRTWAPAWQGAA